MAADQPRKIVLQLPLKEPSQLPEFVEQCLRDQVTLIAIIGDGCAAIEDEIDDLIVGDGSDETRFITTTSHPDESLEDVMEFAEFWTVDGGEGVGLVHL